VPPDDAANVYVYGVLTGADAADVAVGGVEGADVRAVKSRGLAALVSTLEGDALAAAREVRAHWRVLEEASKRGPVLPVRFGTVMDSDAAVREQLLEPRADELTELLGALAGRVQLSVKGEYDGENLLRDVVRASPPIAALRDRVRELPENAGYYERIRLGELVAAEIARRRERDEALALTRLERPAAASRVEELSSPNAAFNLAFLVDREGVDRFSEAVGKLREELGEGVSIRYVGPLPPYSFVDAELGDGAPAWA
jgi:Gas vesicle synthesis protein GvpL/GvpF